MPTTKPTPTGRPATDGPWCYDPVTQTVTACCVHPKTKELVSCNVPFSLPLGLALLAVVVLRRKP